MNTYIAPVKPRAQTPKPINYPIHQSLALYLAAAYRAHRVEWLRIHCARIGVRFARYALMTGALALSLPGLATCPSVASATRFAPALDSDGTPIVLDLQTGLTWKRCAEGQTWASGPTPSWASSPPPPTCTGPATTYTYEQALFHAQSVGGAVGGWRLPNIRELGNLADDGCQNQAIDTTAFPGATSDHYWASSPYSSNVVAFWCVDFRYGNAGGDYRLSNNAVRLVRSSQ